MLTFHSVFGLVSLAFTNQTPNYRAFSVVDLGISYPIRHETVSVSTLVVASVLVPAVVILLVCIVFVPSLTAKGFSRSQIIRHKLWEWNTGWMGLALSLATAILVTSGMKNIFGKPRPDMLSRCNPDLTRLAEFTIGGFPISPSDHWVLVNQTICQQTDLSILNDGFRSFPSGHASSTCQTFTWRVALLANPLLASWAGLFYLTLFLASKFSIGLPTLPPSDEQNPLPPVASTAKMPMLQVTTGDMDDSARTKYRDEAAAPPTYLLVLVFVPLGAAIFITGSRYFNYRHHGFDIISGTIIGIVTAWFSFRWYHLPLGRGSGWSWGPRSPAKAFGVGVGSHGYVDQLERTHERVADIEMGAMGGREQVRGQVWSDERSRESTDPMSMERGSTSRLRPLSSGY